MASFRTQLHTYPSSSFHWLSDPLVSHVLTLEPAFVPSFVFFVYFGSFQLPGLSSLCIKPACPALQPSPTTVFSLQPRTASQDHLPIQMNSYCSSLLCPAVNQHSTQKRKNTHTNLVLSSFTKEVCYTHQLYNSALQLLVKHKEFFGGTQQVTASAKWDCNS